MAYRMWRVAAALLSLLAAQIANSESAQAQHRDVLVAVEDKTLVTGAFDWGAARATIPERVFARAFEFTGDDFAASTNPGFNAIAAPPIGFAPLPGGSEVYLRLVALPHHQETLLHWDGLGEPAFAPVPSEETFLITGLGRGEARAGHVANPPSAERSRIVVARTFNNGVMHEHFELIVLGAAAARPMTQDASPTPGIYAVAVSFELDGYSASEPAVILLQSGGPEAALESARQWWQSVVEEPPGAAGGCSLAPGAEPRLPWSFVFALAFFVLTRRCLLKRARETKRASKSGLLLRGAAVAIVVANLQAELPAANAQDCSLQGEGELGFGLVEHSCFHTEFGPFEKRTATAGEVPSEETPNVDPVHTHYSVSVEPGVWNVVTYTPRRSGTWAFFGDEVVEQQLRDVTGVVLPVLLQHNVTGCEELPVVRVFQLEAGQTYTVAFAPAEVEETFVEIEKVSDFETVHGFDTDGDGFGSAVDTLATPCVPPDGYVRNADDCNDSDPDIHPDVRETCDGFDENCNGLIDEGACGAGELAGDGAVGCSLSAGEVVCPARPGRDAFVVLALLALSFVVVTLRGHKKAKR